MLFEKLFDGFEAVTRLPSRGQANSLPVSDRIEVNVSTDSECYAERRGAIETNFFLVFRTSNSERTEESSTETLNAASDEGMAHNGRVR